MGLHRRHFLCFMAAALSMRLAFAQKFPARPIHLVVPFAPGGATDMMARHIALRLADLLGQAVVVDNKPGGGGNIAGTAVAGSPPDGYTLLIGGMETATNPHLMPSKTFNPTKDLTPIASLTLGSLVLIVNPNKTKFNTLGELIAAAKAHPDELTFGSAGNGSVNHLFGEVFKRAARIEIRHVPYRGAAPAMADLQGGQISMMFAGRAGAQPLVAGGQMKALAMTGRTTHSTLPGVPTFEQVGLAMPDTDLGAWIGLFGPAGMPGELVTQINQAVNTVLAQPELREAMAQLGQEVDPATPEMMATRLASQTQRWGQLIKAANISLQ